MQKLLFLSAEDFGFGPVSVLTQALATVSIGPDYQFVVEANTNYQTFLRKNGLVFSVKKDVATILKDATCQGSIVCQNPITALHSWKHNVPCIYLDNFFWFWEFNQDRIQSLYQKIMDLKGHSDQKFAEFLQSIAQQHPHDLYLAVHFFTQSSLIQYFGPVVQERTKILSAIAPIPYHYYGATIAPLPKPKKQPLNAKPYIYTQLGGMLSPQTGQTYLADYLTVVCGALNYFNRQHRFRIECKVPDHLLSQLQPQFPNITLLTTVSFNQHMSKIRQADYLFIQPGINSIFEAVYFDKRLFVLPELNPSHSSNITYLLENGFRCHHHCFYSTRNKNGNLVDSSYLTAAVDKLLNQKYQQILAQKFKALFVDKNELENLKLRKEVVTKLVKNFRGSKTAGSHIAAFVEGLRPRPQRSLIQACILKMSNHLQKH